MKSWIVRFSENGEEYTGHMTITAEGICISQDEEHVIWADGVRIEMDERIVSAEEIK